MATHPGFPTLPPWLSDDAFRAVQRIEVGLEGDWTGTARVIWARSSGFQGFETAVQWHPTRRPAVELCLDGGWIGVVAAMADGSGYQLDLALVHHLISRAEAAA